MGDDCIILALDPGVTTGAAVLNPDSRALASFEWTIHEVFDFLPRLKAGDTMIVENFVMRPGLAKKTKVYEPLWIIGACKYVADRIGCQLVLQEPSEAKTWADRDRLKGWGVDKKVMVGPHRLDAMRHLSLWLGKQKLLYLLGGLPEDDN